MTVTNQPNITRAISSNPANKADAEILKAELKIHQTKLSAIKGCGPFRCGPCRSTAGMTSDKQKALENLANQNLSKVATKISQLNKQFPTPMSSMTKGAIGAVVTVATAGLVYATGLVGRVYNMIPSPSMPTFSMPTFSMPSMGNLTFFESASSFGSTLVESANGASSALVGAATMTNVAIGVGGIAAVLIALKLASPCLKPKQA